MTAREGPAARGSRQGRHSVETVVREFRDARLGAGLSQEAVGRAIDRSDAWISWTESGRNQALSITDASRMLACVGLELSIRAYPGGRGLRDEAQLTLIAALKRLIAPRWGWRTEVPIPIFGDQRAWDIVMQLPNLSIGVEAETRLRDIQAVDRRVMLKLRDSQLDRAILLVASTRANRATLRDLAGSVSANYPISSRRALEALAYGRDPGGNAIVMLRSSSARTEP